jgi:hypothetical protein
LTIINILDSGRLICFRVSGYWKRSTFNILFE